MIDYYLLAYFLSSDIIILKAIVPQSGTIVSSAPQEMRASVRSAYMPAIYRQWHRAEVGGRPSKNKEVHYEISKTFVVPVSYHPHPCPHRSRLCFCILHIRSKYQQYQYYEFRCAILQLFQISGSAP